MFYTKNFFNALILALISVTLIIGSSYKTFGEAPPTFEGKEAILSTKPKAKGTTGVVPLYFNQNKAYILLGREIKDGNFSDFGGANDGKTFSETAILKLDEETSKRLKLTATELERDGYVTYKENQDREILYVVYPISDQQFGLSQKITKNNIKDLFIWLPVEDLLKVKNSEEIEINDINNKSQKIKIRQFFIDDCLNNRDFKEIIQYISNSRQK